MAVADSNDNVELLDIILQDANSLKHATNLKLI